MNGEMAEEAQICGESYDHDLDEQDPVDGLVAAHCRTCGAELVWEVDE